jgi:hypothetical protein
VSTLVTAFVPFIPCCCRMILCTITRVEAVNAEVANSQVCRSAGLPPENVQQQLIIRKWAGVRHVDYTGAMASDINASARVGKSMGSAEDDDGGLIFRAAEEAPRLGGERSDSVGMDSSVEALPLRDGVWEPDKDPKTGRVFWTNHALQNPTGRATGGKTVGHCQPARLSRKKSASLDEEDFAKIVKVRALHVFLSRAVSRRDITISAPRVYCTRNCACCPCNRDCVCLNSMIRVRTPCGCRGIMLPPRARKRRCQLHPCSSLDDILDRPPPHGTPPRPAFARAAPRSSPRALGQAGKRLARS